MIYNYHTHTKRCGHAKGEVEDYIKRAIENGIKYMGFSEHFPYVCSDGFEAGYRLPVSEVEDYFSEISTFREKYKEEIDIKIGFEMEYYSSHFHIMLENAIRYGAEYLILGPHFMEEESPGTFYVANKTDNKEYLKKYVKCVTEGIKTGVFTYVAHPDLFNFSGDEEFYKSEMRKICIASREYNIPLEINFLGIRDNRAYPRKLFWEIAGEEQAPVTFGFDAHDAKNAFDDKSLITAKEMCSKYKLNYIGKPELINIQKLAGGRKCPKRTNEIQRGKL